MTDVGRKTRQAFAKLTTTGLSDALSSLVVAMVERMQLAMRKDTKA